MRRDTYKTFIQAACDNDTTLKVGRWDLENLVTPATRGHERDEYSRLAWVASHADGVGAFREAVIAAAE